MTSEPKRIEIEQTTIGAGGTTQVRFGPGTGIILRRLVNYHNIWWGFGVEPQNTDANSNGWWILWLKSNTNDADPAWTETQINSNDFNMLIIACGVWTASNQTPYNFSSNMNSSRNLVANQELVLTVRQNGITAGVSQINLVLCAGLSVK